MKERIYQVVIGTFVVSLGTVLYLNSQKEQPTKNDSQATQTQVIQSAKPHYDQVDIQNVLQKQSQKTTQTQIEIASKAKTLEESFQKSLRMIEEHNKNNPHNQIVVGDIFKDVAVQKILPQTSTTSPTATSLANTTTNSKNQEILDSNKDGLSTYTNSTLTSNKTSATSSTNTVPQTTTGDISTPTTDSSLTSYQTSISEIQQVLESLNQKLN